MQVVSNTSPLSALSIIGRPGLLRTQFGNLRIPMAVWTELSVKIEIDRIVQEAGFFVSNHVRNTFLAEAEEDPGKHSSRSFPP